MVTVKKVVSNKGPATRVKNAKNVTKNSNKANTKSTKNTNSKGRTNSNSNKPKNSNLKASDFTLRNLVDLRRSNNKEVAKFANNELNSIFYTKPLSGPEREERTQLAKRKLGLSKVQDVHMNKKDMNTKGLMTWFNSAHTKKKHGNERFIIKDKIDQRVIPKGVKLLPVSGDEPEFVKWLWGAKKKYIQANNCYAYASNQFRFHRHHKAQPGEKRRIVKGVYPHVPLDCKKLTEAVLKDADNGAYKCDPDKPCSKGFYKIMLVKAPNPMYQDFHFYRQDKDGTWSHKQGWGYGPTKLDADGKVIIDPRKSNRNFKPFNYSIVCSSMCVPKEYKHNI